MSTRNKALIITGIIILVLALVAFLVGGWLAGWDFVAYFKSPAFIWVAVLVGVYMLFAGALFVKEWIDNK